MNYYEKYNIFIVLSTLILSLIVLVIIFKRHISSLIDPIVLHFIWFASCTALLIGYIYRFGLTVDSFLFLMTFLLYGFFLYLFLRGKRNIVIEIEKYSSVRLLERAYIVFTILIFYSKLDFIIFASKSTLIEWFLYRFILLEGRNPLQFIIKLGGSPFFYLFSFLLIANKHRWKKALILIFTINLVIDILSGGRSSLLNLIFAFGTFVLKFKFGNNVKGEIVRKVNYYGLAMISVSLIVAIGVSSLYSQDVNVGDGAFVIFDRIISAGDGLDMYLLNDASKYLDSGIIPYLKSALGIFLGQLFSVDTKSIGWRLYELNSGLEIDVAAGPNYILPLQVAVLGYWYLLPYTAIIAFIVAKLRTISLKGIGGNALSYALSYNCFTLLIDIEYAILIYVSIFFVYFIFLFPLSHIKVTGKIGIFPKFVIKS